MSLPDGFIPVDQARPPEPADGPRAPASEQTDWSMCMMTIAERLYDLNASIVALRETVANQAGMICAQTHLLSAMLRVMAERLPPGEVDAALTAHMDGAAAGIDAELVPSFCLAIAMVKVGAGLGEPEPPPVVH